MTVLRIVPNIAVADPDRAKRFYRDLLDLEVAMDHGWIVTFARTDQSQVPQLSFATEGGSGTPVPDLSIEVDDADIVYASAQAAGLEIIYPISDEPWGVRRFYVRDPFGKIVNILAHKR